MKAWPSAVFPSVVLIAVAGLIGGGEYSPVEMPLTFSVTDSTTREMPSSAKQSRWTPLAWMIPEYRRPRTLVFGGEFPGGVPPCELGCDEGVGLADDFRLPPVKMEKKDDDSACSSPFVGICPLAAFPLAVEPLEWPFVCPFAELWWEPLLVPFEGWPLATEAGSAIGLPMFAER